MLGKGSFKRFFIYVELFLISLELIKKITYNYSTELIRNIFIPKGVMPYEETYQVSDDATLYLDKGTYSKYFIRGGTHGCLFFVGMYGSGIEEGITKR